MDGRREGTTVTWKVTMALAVFTCAWLVSGLLLSTLADAKIRFQGYDFSRAIVGSGDTDMIVCDRERDGNSAYVKYNRVGGAYYDVKRMVDPTADPPCQKNFGIRQIDYHKTCEDRVGFANDPCTAYSYH